MGLELIHKHPQASASALIYRYPPRWRFSSTCYVAIVLRVTREVLGEGRSLRLQIYFVPD